MFGSILYTGGNENIIGNSKITITDQVIVFFCLQTQSHISVNLSIPKKLLISHNVFQIRLVLSMKQFTNVKFIKQYVHFTILTLSESWSSSASSIKSTPIIPYHLLLIPWAAYICHFSNDIGEKIKVRFNSLKNNYTLY